MKMNKYKKIITRFFMKKLDELYNRIITESRGNSFTFSDKAIEIFENNFGQSRWKLELTGVARDKKTGEMKQVPVVVKKFKAVGSSITSDWPHMVIHMECNGRYYYTWSPQPVYIRTNEINIKPFSLLTKDLIETVYYPNSDRSKLVFKVRKTSFNRGYAYLSGTVTITIPGNVINPPKQEEHIEETENSEV